MSLSQREEALRRFTAVWAVSLAVKLTAVALVLYLVWALTGRSL